MDNTKDRCYNTNLSELINTTDKVPLLDYKNHDKLLKSVNDCDNQTDLGKEISKNDSVTARKKTDGFNTNSISSHSPTKYESAINDDFIKGKCNSMQPARNNFSSKLQETESSFKRKDDAFNKTEANDKTACNEKIDNFDTQNSDYKLIQTDEPDDGLMIDEPDDGIMIDEPDDELMIESLAELLDLDYEDILRINRLPSGDYDIIFKQ